MQITHDLTIVDLALYCRKAKTLVLSDIHMGYEEALNKQGILVPRQQFSDTMERLERLFSSLEKKRFPVNTILLNGDVKHEFGTISETEWRHTLRLLEYLSMHCKEIILIKGNHDKILGPIAKKRGITISDYYVAEDILFVHGNVLHDELLTKKIKTIVIGHEHCAISVTQWPRTEKFKCFLKGVYKRKTLIAMPSFNLVTEGTDVLKESLLSPYLHSDLRQFSAYVVTGSTIFEFGKIGKLIGKTK